MISGYTFQNVILFMPYSDLVLREYAISFVITCLYFRRVRKKKRKKAYPSHPLQALLCSHIKSVHCWVVDKSRNP